MVNREQPQRHQLKRLSKLSEWASGTGLLEDEVSTKSQLSNQKDATIRVTEINTKTAATPTSASSFAHTRRSGSEVLQVSAIYQLQGYLVGEYGQQFKRPAFILLTSLWPSITQSIPDSDDIKRKEILKSLLSSPVAQAIAFTLLTNRGQALREHAALLPGMNLSGLLGDLPGLNPLRLNHLNLEGIHLTGAKLRKVRLQEADLRNAFLLDVDLMNARLQGAVLPSANLKGANMVGAALHGANLFDAMLCNANLTSAELQGADLRGANLKDAKLNHADLRSANLEDARLYGADLSCASFDANSKFAQSQTDDDTKVVMGKDALFLARALTHALRLKLRDINILHLPDSAYEEFKPQWDTLSESERKTIYEKAYAYSADPEQFENDFPHLAQST